MATHVSALLRAAILLGLVWVARLRRRRRDAVNWLAVVRDEFAERATTENRGVDRFDSGPRHLTMPHCSWGCVS